jgi:phosphate transport system permease protein
VFLASFFELIILSGFIFKERSVKPILVVLSSTTSIAVVVIIFFIFREGIPAFYENDPVQFITGSAWTADYEPETDDIVTFTIEIVEYDHEFESPGSKYYIKDGEESNITMVLKNSGNLKDTYQITSDTDSSLEIEKGTFQFELEPGETISFNITLFSENEGHYDMSVFANSMESGKRVNEELTIIAGDYGIDIFPENVELLAADFEVPRMPIFLKNTGRVTDTYQVTVEYPPDIMKPSLTGNVKDWDFDNDMVNITLDAGETLEATFVPRIIVLSPGINKIDLTATSLSDPNVNDTVTIMFEYRDLDFFEVDTFNKNIRSGNFVEIPFNISIYNPRGSNFTFQIMEIEGPVGTYSVYGEEFLVTETGNKVDINLSEEGKKELVLNVTSLGSASDGDNITVTLELGRSGSEPEYGIGPMIIGTILVVIIALIIAIPLGLGAAIFLAEYCNRRLHSILRPMFELLAGIPSIIYGLWGYFTLAPFFRDNINSPISDTIGRIIPFFSVTENTPTAEGTVIVAGLVLSIMILPIIITLSEDSIRSVSRNLKEGSLALATSKWQTIRGVIIRKSRSGIISSIILAMGRAIGETMAVVMILRLATTYPNSIFERAGSMTGTIAQTFGWSFDLDRSRHAVFGIAIVLFIMVFALNILVYYIQYGTKNKKKTPHGYLTKIVDKILRRKRNISLDGKNIFGTISEMKRSFKMVSPKWIHTKELLSKIFMYFSAGIIGAFLLLVLSDVIFTGISSTEVSYLYEREVAGGLADGGFSNAIVGSIQLTALTLMLSVPFSVGAAIYVQQYSGEGNFFTRIILFASDTLASTPSIVYGAFGFIFFSIELEFGLSVLSAALTLAIMVIPLLLRSSIEALKGIPKEMSDGSLALGASKWQTIWHVILPPSMGGITSGIILSIGRAIGETAAILFTAGYALGYNNSIMSPVATMPNMIYNYYGLTAHAPDLRDKIYSCAFVLIMVVLIMNSIARYFQWRSNRMMKGKY